MNALIPITNDGRAVGLEIPKSLPFDQWVDLGKELHAQWRQAEGRRTQVLWWIGDWWAFGGEADQKTGKPRYGDRAKVAATGIFGVEFGTCMNAGSVARTFETSRRREVLSFKHHAELAGISNKSPPAADELLDRAEIERLSTRDLRGEIIKARTRLGDFPERPRSEDPDPEDEDYVAICRKWNRSQGPGRLAFLQSLEELGIVELIDDADLLQDVRLRV